MLSLRPCCRTLRTISRLDRRDEIVSMGELEHSRIAFYILELTITPCDWFICSEWIDLVSLLNHIIYIVAPDPWLNFWMRPACRQQLYRYAYIGHNYQGFLPSSSSCTAIECPSKTSRLICSSPSGRWCSLPCTNVSLTSLSTRDRRMASYMSIAAGICSLRCTLDRRAPIVAPSSKEEFAPCAM